MFQKISDHCQDSRQRLIVVISSVVLALITSYIYMVQFVQQVYDNNSAIVSELITGPSIFKDYYKPADFMIPRHFILAFLLCFVIYYLVILGVSLLHERLSMSFYALIFAVGFLLFKGYFGYEVKMLLVAACSLLLLHVIDVLKQYQEKEQYDASVSIQVYTSWIFAYFGVRAFIQMFLTIGMISESAAKKGLVLLLILAYVLLIFIYVFGKKLTKFPLLMIYSEGAQALLLAFFVSLFRFKVNYNGVIESTKYTGIRVLAVLAVLLILVYAFIKRKEFLGKNHPYSFMIIAAMQLTMDAPVDGFNSINLFHYGELTVPFSQLASFGKMPYFDFFPIHGICDYFFASINAIVCDGTYGSFFYAYYIGSIILVALVAYVIYKCVDQDFYKAILAAFFIIIGEWYYYFRFVLVLPIILIFFHEKIRKSAYASLIVYTVSSIISIAWYPAIGGSLAVALLIPLAIRILSKDGRNQLADACKKDNYKKYLPSFLATLILGISFIPMFFGIVRYLKENVGISGYFPGDRLKDLIDSVGNWGLFHIPNPFVDVVAIAFVFMIALVLIASIACYYKKISYFEVFIAIAVFCYMICSYTFGSIFAGERATIVNVVLLVLIVYVLGQSKSSAKVLPAMVIAFAFMINTYDYTYAQQSAISYEQISDQFVKVNGADIGCKNMGTVFMNADLKAQTEDFAYVMNALCPDGETYLDFTNQAAYYMMYDKETPFAYCALYHGTSDATRKQMYDSLKEKLPKLILVSPYWYNDGGSISLRYKEIYQYILEKGYSPYQYNSVCFLLSNDAEVPSFATDGSYAFFEAMATKDLQGLPAVWGRSMKRENFDELSFSDQLIGLNSMETDGNGSYYINGDDPYFKVEFSGNNIAKEAEYLLIHCEMPENLATDEDDEYNMEDGMFVKLYFTYPDAGAMEEVAINCVFKNGDLLIPLYAYPMWNMFEMTTIQFDIEDKRANGRTFTVSYELLKDKIDK